jgi:hypothetical protein
VKGQWFAFAAYLIIGFLAAAVLWSVGLIQNWFTLMLIGLNIYLGFEASTLERMWLNYRGWKEVGTVAGRNLPECERRFFDNWLSALPVDTQSMTLSAEPGFFGTSWRRVLFGRA